MNFVSELLENEGHMMVIKCIYRFNKMVQLELLLESDAYIVADKFLSMVVSEHGLPECIMSDCDPHFCGHFWEELISLWDMTLTFSMALHPQTDGMAEVTNHTMEQLL